MDLADDHQASSMDLFTFLSREAEKTLRRSAGLSGPQSAYDGSRLAIPCPGTGPLRRRSSPPLHTTVKPSSSSRRKKRRHGAPSCVSAREEESPTAAAARPGAVTPLLAGGRVAASKPASSSATALSPRLAAATWCSEATPDELEQRLRFFARQIKSFRRISLMYSSPELLEKIRQIEGNYETAVRQFYCRPPSTPGLQGAAAEQPTPGLQSAAEFPEGPVGGLPPRPEDVVRGTPRLKSSGVSATPQLLFTPLRVLSSFWPLNPETKGSRRKRRRTLFLKGSRNSLYSFWPLNPETRVRKAPLRLQAPRVLLAYSLSMRPWLTGARLNSVPAGDDLPVARLNSVPAGDDLPVARLNSVPAGDDLPVARLNFVFVSGPPAIAPTARPNFVFVFVKS
ncbi:hypothetical protein CRENBAI_006082 [Crenichthys baileyi]|uniref:Uncharacterized protein n=1 Tax=Crenichthys baileyi TaxID=28760 RepID=A0AAV9QU06_9TELE